MAAYATAEQLIQHLGYEVAAQLSDASGGVYADEDLLLTLLIRASAEMDTYLGRKLILPLTAPSASFAAWLEQLALDIATYRLFVLRRLGDVEDARRRYDDAITWLKGFAEGETVEPPTEPPEAGDVPGTTDYYSRDQVYTDDLLSSF